MGRDRRTNVHFAVRVGNRIPRHVHLFPIAAAVYDIFPYYRGYDYVVVEDTICIVDPATYEIVDVIDSGPVGRPQVAHLSLSSSQRTIVLDSIPADFPEDNLHIRLALGADLPRSIELHEFAPIVLDRVPELRDFRFVVTPEQVVIVDPSDRDIALVLDR